MTHDEMTEIVHRLYRLLPFDVGEDPVLWRQTDTVNRAVKIVEEFYLENEQ